MAAQHGAPTLHPVRSVVRLRPLSVQEPRELAFAFSRTKLTIRREILEHEGRADWLADSEYNFDAVLGPEATTSAVYEAAAAEIVPSVLKGINCTLIAYGQTGSGKTHTMLGSAAAAPSASPLTPCMPVT